MKQSFTALAVLFAFNWTGCATVVRGNTQQVHVGTYDATTNKTVEADCVLESDDGSWRSRSNGALLIPRDKNLLRVSCQNEELSGEAAVDGKINAGFILVDLLLIDACLISCWIDGTNGSWASFPEAIEVPMNPKTSLKPSKASEDPGTDVANPKKAGT